MPMVFRACCVTNVSDTYIFISFTDVTWRYLTSLMITDNCSRSKQTRSIARVTVNGELEFGWPQSRTAANNYCLYGECSSINSSLTSHDVIDSRWLPKVSERSLCGNRDKAPFSFLFNAMFCWKMMSNGIWEVRCLWSLNKFQHIFTGMQRLDLANWFFCIRACARPHVAVATGRTCFLFQSLPSTVLCRERTRLCVWHAGERRHEQVLQSTAVWLSQGR